MQLPSGMGLLSGCLGPCAVAAAFSIGEVEPCSALQSSGDHLRPFQSQPVPRQVVQRTEVRFEQAQSGELRFTEGHSGERGDGARVDSDTRSGSITSAESDAAAGLSADSVAFALTLAPSAARPLLAVRPGPGDGGARSQPLAGAVVSLLVLGLGLGLHLRWRQGLRRRNRGGRGRERLLPPPGFRPRTPHERLHDPVYLQRLLEVEQDNALERDCLDSQR